MPTSADLHLFRRFFLSGVDYLGPPLDDPNCVDIFCCPVILLLLAISLSSSCFHTVVLLFVTSRRLLMSLISSTTSDICRILAPSTLHVSLLRLSSFLSFILCDGISRFINLCRIRSPVSSSLTRKLLLLSTPKFLLARDDNRSAADRRGTMVSITEFTDARQQTHGTGDICINKLNSDRPCAKCSGPPLQWEGDLHGQMQWQA